MTYSGWYAIRPNQILLCDTKLHLVAWHETPDQGMWITPSLSLPLGPL